MDKKLQVFVSSTYKDLIEERQAAVEAILSAGHIPAGMELFAAGNDTQLDTIKRWIDISDIYLLILGGRYGTTDLKSKKSYTQIEYEYALRSNIPLFAIVISDKALDEKVRKMGNSVMEIEYHNKYISFRKLVLSKTCRFFDDLKDIKIAIHETLVDFEKRFEFTGWISGTIIKDYEKLNYENSLLKKENVSLKTELDSIKLSSNHKTNNVLIAGVGYDEIVEVLKNISVTVPANISSTKKEFTTNILDLFVSNQNNFATGFDNAANSSDNSKFNFFKVAPKLLAFNLLDRINVGNNGLQRVQTSIDGFKFLSIFEMKKSSYKNKKTGA